MLRALYYLLASIRCAFDGHRYRPSYAERTEVSRRGNLHRQYQYHCCRCAKPTPWLPMRTHQTFLRVYKPDWSNR